MNQEFAFLSLRWAMSAAMTPTMMAVMPYIAIHFSMTNAFLTEVRELNWFSVV